MIRLQKAIAVGATAAIATSFLSGCTKRRFTKQVEEACAQRVLKLTNVPGYTFGPNDAKMRNELLEIKNNYVNTGKDIVGSEMVAWVRKYVPSYVDACLTLYKPGIDECTSLAGTEKFQECADKYDENYRLILDAYMMDRQEHPEGSVDISKITADAMRRSYRRMQVDPAESLSTGSVIGSIQKAFSPIPTIEDVSANENIALSAVATAGPDQGIRADFALSKTAPETPTFYVATNQPAGTELQLLIDPVVGTLVADAPGTIQATLTVTEKLGKTAQIKNNDGSNLPMGEYKIDLKDKDNHVLTSHQYFLGGVKDGAYQTRLNDYVNRRKSSAQPEAKLYKTVANKIDAREPASTSFPAGTK